MALESDLSKISAGGNGETSVTPTPAPVLTPEPVVQTPEPVAVSDFSLRNIATERGYDPAGFSDDKALAAALFDAAEQYNQMQPLAQIGRQFAPYVDRMGDFQEYLAAKDAEAKAAAEEAAKAALPPAMEWRKAEYDPQWERFCEQDQRTGTWQPIGGAPQFQTYANKLNEATEARRFNSQQVVSDLPGLLDKYYAPRETSLKQSIIEEARKEMQQEFARRQQEAEAQAYIQQHAKDFYQCDATGYPLIGSDGQPRLSLKGEAMAQHATALRDSGITDPYTIRNYAEMAVAADEAAGRFRLAAAPQAAAPIVPVATPQPKKLFLDRVTKNLRSPQRGGTIPDDTVPTGTQQNPSADLGDVIKRVAAQQGVQLQI